VYVIPLSAVLDADPGSVGGKAWSVGRMLRTGLPVPDGLCVTDAGLDNLRSSGLRAELAEALQRLGSSAVAVRSSAGAEDSSAHSYAGIFKSFLNVVKRPDAVITALDGVRESAGGRLVETYERATGSANSSMAAIVQDMVEPAWSGVMFTCDPVTSEDHILVEATRHEDPAPEYAAVDRAGSVVPGSASAGFAELLTIVDDLVAIARRCEQIFGRPQDIEWVWDGRQVWVLQSRHITTS
jgi:phosphoenolpyruvate synthase/pyruvate phosphate dikinase